VPVDDLAQASFERNLDAAIKRFASGFTRTIAVVAPVADTLGAGMGMRAPRFGEVQAMLRADFDVQAESLNDGSVSGEADVLLLLAPDKLGETEVFAIDQFLMQGGTVIVASSPFRSNIGPLGLVLRKHDSGLAEWLSHHGLTIGEQLVLDPQNAMFPLPVTRNVGGFQVQDVGMFDYPYFVDIREDGLNQDSAITADLPQLIMPWVSPITVAEPEPAGRKITRLLHSSEGSWLSDSTEVSPQLDANGLSRFQPEGATGRHLLAVISAGRFESFFAGRPSPMLEEPAGDAEGDDSGGKETEDGPLEVSAVIERSPESARIVLFSSNDFLDDQVMGLAGAGSGSEYLNSLQLMANTIDWALDDEGLAGIRSRGHFNRTLPPMDTDQQVFWEYLNYALAGAAIALVALLQWLRRRRRERGYVEMMACGEGAR
jgi:ABC-2 type transport system permease protein